MPRLRVPLSFVLLIGAIACADAPTSAPGESATVGPPALAVNPPVSLWTAQTLPLLSNTSGSRANDIANDGTIVGEAFDVVNGYPSNERPYFWRSTVGTRGILPISGATGYALGISDNGRYIAGYVVSNGERIPVRWNLDPDPQTVGPSVTYLRTCSGQFYRGGRATAVNDAGIVVGNDGPDAVRWTRPEDNSICPATIAFSGVEMTFARDINDAGKVVGYGFSPTTGFITGTVSYKLQPLAGDTWTDAHAINELGEVVGTSSHAGGYTAVYRSPVINSTVAMGATGAGRRVSLSEKGRVVWAATNLTTMTRKGTATHALNVLPRGVNACGHIVGEWNLRATVYWKKACD
jgi:uncharacterized membrane protein